MKVLAFDSVSSSCSVAILEDNKISYSKVLRMERGHAESLVPMINEAVLATCDKFSQIDLVGCTVGPGSFTGVRVGLSTAVGLSVSANKPLIGVTSFEVVAERIRITKKQNEQLLVVVLETKRNDFFVQTFSVESRPLDQPRSIHATKFVEYMLSLKNPFNHILLAGDGVNRALEYIKDKPTNLNLTLEGGCGGPLAWDIATLIKAKFELNQSFPLPKPLYLRQPDVTKQKSLRKEKDS